MRPRSSSTSSVARSWLVSCFGASLAVFPSIAGRPELPGLLVGWYGDVCVCYDGLAGFDAPRVIFPSGVARPGCSASWPFWTRRTVLFVFVVNHCSCMYKVGFTGDSAPHAVFLSLLLSGPDARHPGRYGPEGHLCCEVVAALVADYDSGMFLLVLLVDAVRAVFTSLSAGPPAGGQLRGEILADMVHMVQTA